MLFERAPQAGILWKQSFDVQNKQWTDVCKLSRASLTGSLDLRMASPFWITAFCDVGWLPWVFTYNPRCLACLTEGNLVSLSLILIKRLVSHVRSPIMALEESSFIKFYFWIKAVTIASGRQFNILSFLVIFLNISNFPRWNVFSLCQIILTIFKVEETWGR